MSRRSASRFPDVAIGVVAVLVLALGVLAFQHARPDVSETVGNAPALPTPPPPEAVVLVIGDSFVGGSLMNTGPEWPARMGAERGWVTVNEGSGGTGYINDGQTDDIPTRVESMEYGPDLIVVAGGINDAGKYPTSAIVAAAGLTLDRLGERFTDVPVVMISPFANATVQKPTIELTKELRGFADDRGVPFLNKSRLFEDRPDLIGDDGTHPTDAGHELLAQSIGDDLAPLVMEVCTGSRCTA
jgi:lysophospholipase L1-like esterase